MDHCLLCGRKCVSHHYSSTRTRSHATIRTKLPTVLKTKLHSKISHAVIVYFYGATILNRILLCSCVIVRVSTSMRTCARRELEGPQNKALHHITRETPPAAQSYHTYSTKFGFSPSPCWSLSPIMCPANENRLPTQTPPIPHRPAIITAAYPVKTLNGRLESSCRS